MASFSICCATPSSPVKSTGGGINLCGIGKDKALGQMEEIGLETEVEVQQQPSTQENNNNGLLLLEEMHTAVLKDDKVLEQAAKATAKVAPVSVKKRDETTKELKSDEGGQRKPHWYKEPLPKPPVPLLEHSFLRLQEYAAVVAECYELPLADFKRCCEEFYPIAERLQQDLEKIAEQEENWVNKFWLPAMYLRQRAPLPVNFNPFYVFPRQQFFTSRDQLEYATWLVLGILRYKERIDKREIPLEFVPSRQQQTQHLLPQKTLGETNKNEQKAAATKTPLCMDQYDRVLGCYREARPGEDIHHHHHHVVHRDPPEIENSEEVGAKKRLRPQPRKHIVVLCENQVFVVHTHDGEGRLLAHGDILAQLEHTQHVAKNRHPSTVVPVSAATVGDRETAAKFLELMLDNEKNEESFEWIRSALFVLCLDRAFLPDKEDPPKSENKINSNQINHQHHQTMIKDVKNLLHGHGAGKNGLNRWFDATIQLVVSACGCNGLSIEHSIAEGIVIIQMGEWAVEFATENFSRSIEERKQISSNHSALANGFVKNVHRKPKPLCWAISEQAQTLLTSQIEQFQKLSENLDFELLEFTEFGKEQIKQWSISPDGFVQLAMQLAHFQVHGRLVSTYESATLRRFRFGRVDNIRAATPDALLWVKAMCAEEDVSIRSSDVRTERRRELLHAVAKKQALITLENISGHGIDNHFCALELLAEQAVAEKRLPKEPALFENQIWQELFRFPLSTSQVSTSPHMQGSLLGYGPVVSDGYGCAYNIQPEKILFAVSTFRSCREKSALAFRDQLSRALHEMALVLGGTTTTTTITEKRN